MRIALEPGKIWTNAKTCSKCYRFYPKMPQKMAWRSQLHLLLFYGQRAGRISRAQVFSNPGSHIATSTWQLDMYIVKTMRKLYIYVIFRGRRTLQFLSTLVSHHQAVLMCFTGSNVFFGQWYVCPLTVGYIHAHAGQLLDPTTIGIHPIQPYEGWFRWFRRIPLLSIKKNGGFPQL